MPQVRGQLRLTWPRFHSTVPTQKPFVFPLTPCNKVTSKEEAMVTLGCLVKDYIPEPVNVTWDSTSPKKSILALPDTFHLTSGLYSTTSYVTTSGDWAKHQFTCSVKHAESPTISVTFPQTECARNITQPSVKLYHSSCDPRGNTHATIRLLCLVTNFTPDNITVTWLVDGQETENMFPTTSPLQQEGQLASVSSQLNITQGQWVSQRTYTCKVNYRGCTFEDHARNCPESEPRGVSVYLIPPNPLDLYIHKSPKIVCLVVDLASVEGMSLQWFGEGGVHLNKDTKSTRRQYNMTYTAMSTLPVDTRDWVKGETYGCILKHPHLPTEIVRTIAKATGKRAVPEVYVFLPPEEDQQTKDTVTLTCLIQNFFPEDISVQWLRNDVLTLTGQHTTTRPLKASNASRTFFVFSRLVVRRADWEKRDTFTCRVVHEALPGSRTLDRSVSKNPELDLQDLYVETAESVELEGVWTSVFVFIALFLLSVTYGASVTIFKAKWVLAAVLRETPQPTLGYANIVQPAAWARSMGSAGLAASLPASEHP